MTKEEMKNKYSAFITEISEILGLGKPVDILKLCATTDLFFQPLEKRIAELEKENAEYKEVFGSCGTCKRSCDIGNCCDPRTKSSYLLDKVKVIVERQKLLKENTELKEENKVLAQNLEDTEILNKTLVNRNAELKELLKQWLQTSKASGCDNINIVTDTEQFLSEVEK